MSRVKIIWLLVIILILVGVAAMVVAPSRPANPAYDGWLLSEWVKNWGAVIMLTNGAVVTRETNITELDGRAAPYLVSVINREDGWWWRWYMKNWPNWPGWIRTNVPEHIPAEVIRQNALMMLPQTGPGTPRTISALLELASREPKATAVAVRTALIRQQLSVSLILTSTGSPRVFLLDPRPVQAINVLGQVGSNNPAAIAGLLRIFQQTTNSSVAENGAVSYGLIGGTNEQVADLLVKLIEAGGNRQPQAQISALAQMGHHSSVCVNKLIGVVKDSSGGDPAKFRLVLGGLLELTSESPEALDALLSYMRGNEKPWTERWAAMDLAGRVKDPHSVGLRALIAVAMDESVDIDDRREACAVMEQVHGRTPAFGLGRWEPEDLKAAIRARAQQELDALDVAKDAKK